MNKNIKAIVLDVDGVIIGDKIGFNTPHPNIEVINALHKLRQAGIIISFCTSKPYLGIEKIAQEANLLNPHITDGGAVLYDTSTSKVVDTFGIAGNHVKAIIDKYIQQDLYVAIYTPTSYMIQQSQKCEITERHQFVLQKSPIIVENLSAESDDQRIIKIVVITRNEIEKEKADSIFKLNYTDKLNIKWGQPKIIHPLQFGIITDKAISKGKMLIKMMQRYNLKREEILSIGNSNSDWDFMQETDYVATLENAEDGLKELVSIAGENGYISKSVDENGFVAIIKHYGLL